MKTFRQVNDGVALVGDEKDAIKELRIHTDDSASVQVWVELAEGREYLQYLTSAEAMKLATLLERLAIVVLKREAS